MSFARSRFADHSVDTFAAVLDTAEKIAKAKYAPFNRWSIRGAAHRVRSPTAPCAWCCRRRAHELEGAYAESGMLSAAQDYEIGGMQLPYTVEAAAHSISTRRR